MAKFSETPLASMELSEPEALYLKAADLEGVTFTIVGYERKLNKFGNQVYELQILVDGDSRRVSHGHKQFLEQMDNFQKLWLPMTVTFTRKVSDKTKRTALVIGEALETPFHYPHSTDSVEAKNDFSF